jgi:prepilin-type N-terminal cleavage/methylation domain-containing protein/prepilin-type processing-associated H-X9-DG protein
MKTRSQPQGTRIDFRADAFTLLELLVVIVIIGILASLLLPALAKAKNKALSVECLNNLNQLQLCWHLYTMDNNDLLVPNNSVEAITTNGNVGAIAADGSWCLADPTILNVQKGMLFPFNSTLGIYRCPADRSTLDDPSGRDHGTPRARSYNMSQSVNGYPEFTGFINSYIPCFKKLLEIQNPNISSCMVFIDENEYTLEDSQFGMPTDYYDGSRTWWDMPANRHDQAANLSFADGHAEHYKWAVPKTFNAWIQGVPNSEMPDWLRVKRGIHRA